MDDEAELILERVVSHGITRRGSSGSHDGVR
jgi:hypothetical protein